MTKEEEFMLQYADEAQDDASMWTEETIHKALREYAKQEAFGFFKWYGVKMVGFIEYITKIKPLVRSEEFEQKILEFEGQTFDKLHELYLKSKELTQN